MAIVASNHHGLVGYSRLTLSSSSRARARTPSSRRADGLVFVARAVRRSVFRISPPRPDIFHHLATSITDPLGATLYLPPHPGSPSGVKSAGEGRFVSTTLCQLFPPGGAGSAAST